MAENQSTPIETKRVKLTDRFLMNLKPAPSGKRITIWDDVESGLGIQVTPTGHKSFIVVRRISGGGPVKYVCKPPYPTLTLALAREKAIEVKRALANGVNLRQQERERDEERECLKAEETRVNFHQVAEQFIAKKLIGLRSARLIEADIRRDILSQPWARKPIAAVTKSDIVALIHGIRTDRDRSTPGRWSTPAMRAFGYVKRIMSWAVTKDEFNLEINVTTRVNLDEEMAATKPSARERVLDDVEFAAFWKACDRIGYPGGTMLQMLALSCCRLREVAFCSWDEFSVIDNAVEHLAGRVLTVPAIRMKGKNERVDPHTVPITPQMAQILDAIPTFAGGQFVFSQRGGRTPFQAMGSLKTQVDRLMREELPELARWTFHDLRRTGRSNLSRLGISPDIAERCLAHRVGGIRGVYDRFTYLGEKRDALTKLGELYARIIAPTPNVLEFPKPAVLTAS